ncbi:hypothetical protein FE257_012194 [Aspergillus nanangensis]|uniref:Ubiquitin-like domain-containing protein n=1 Tax=Aspergillus nanangensis TaxID=2582783 RepID=A0AAD4CG99_ASPNN|nr:hypothetical protein FE257_012194 [Aspergillus nanangensis]
MTSNLTATDSTSPPTGSSRDNPGFTIHVLCPSLPPPNRFTFKDVPPSSTLAGLKARISQSLPNQPSPGNQRLIYCGKPLSNDGATLQSVLEPVNLSEYSMHLVLPPAPLPQGPADTRTLASVPPRGPMSTLPHQSTPHSRSVPPPYSPHGQGLRYRGPMAPAVPNESEIGLALRRNIETIRRQFEQQERGGSSLPERQDGTPTSLNHVGSQWRQEMPPSPATTTTTTTTTSHFTMSSSTSSIGHLQEDMRLRLHILRPQIALCEDQLNRGIAPPMDHIVRIRSQLFTLLDEQYRNPNAERDGTIESLLSRVFNVYTRADQLRVTQSRTSPNPLPNTMGSATGNNPQAQTPLYLLSSPNGYQALVSPGDADTFHTSLEALRAMHAAQVMPNTNPHQHAPPNANQDAMVNAVRQAVINQRGGNNEQMGLARNVRRVWLFVRLFFFCYMFSEPGSWSRVFLVAFAVLVALLSETSVPQQLYQMTVAPVQRHLEGLVHYAPDEAEHARPQGGNAAGTANRANEPAGTHDGLGGLVPGLRRTLRRIERSLALFVASLVPGVGERHVEVRNAAEAARIAERTREENEQQRRQEETEGNNASQNQATQTNTSTAHPEHPTAETQPNTIPTGDENPGR